MATIINKGGQLVVTAAAAIAAGAMVLVGNIVGYAANAIALGAEGSLDLFGSFSVTKAAGKAWTAGEAVYYDSVNENFTAVPTPVYAGIAAADALLAATTGYILLNEGVAGPGDAPNVIADPGDGEAIPVTASGRVPLVSEGAETRTLAAPSFAGQKLNIELDTDGGDVTLTCATAVNQTGNNTLVFADAGDVIALEAVKVGANYRWRTAFNDGVALSTV